MNRKQRRAQKSGGPDAAARIRGSVDPIELAAAHQADGRPREAVKLLKPLLAREPDHAVANAAIAMAFQALGQRNHAIRHFRKAIASGLHAPETFVRRSPAVMIALERFAGAYPRQMSLAELLGPRHAVAEDALLLAILQSEIVRDVQIELFLTAARRALLALHMREGILDEALFDFACALAEQCFLNEYVYGVSENEGRLVASLKARVAGFGATAAPADLAVLGCYLPLHGLPDAGRLLDQSWPKALEALLTHQVREPLSEASDAAAIPALTMIEDGVSRSVQEQYEENPYPRWTFALPAKPTTLRAFLRERFGLVGEFDGDVLVAGCGTGEHSLDTARNFPQSKVLAIDISRRSLAYARRKTREYGAGNIEYAQADILRLGSLDRRFDLIESVGVLHHLSDPEAGWRVLLSLLRPGGVMRIALYSEIARHIGLDAGRALIAARGYRPIPEDIRAWRQELIQRGEALSSTDFFSISSCRDLCFHVKEHRFTLPRIRRFLDANRLTFLGMETSAETLQQFLREHPMAAAATDLDCWDTFEKAHPLTFASQYYLWVRSGGSNPAFIAADLSVRRDRRAG